MPRVPIPVRLVALVALSGVAAVVQGPARVAAQGDGPRSARVRLAYERIAAIDATNAAWLALDAERATAAARALDTAAASGAALSALDGMLVAVKDNLDTEGVATTAGSARLRSRVPTADATAVALIRAAGGVMLGKTNLDTFARGVRTVSEIRGSTGNAWNSARGPGGSSGGSAVAVATGAADAALGSDTCGSLRYPAAYNGVFGLRPTPGLVSRSGLAPLAPTQDVVGPLARTAADLAAVLRVIAVVDPADPLTAVTGRPDMGAWTLDGPPPRVGVVRTMGAYAKDRSGRTVLDVLAAAGVALVPITLPTLPNPSLIEDEYPVAKAQFLAAVSGSNAAVGQPWLTGPLVVRDGRGYARRLIDRNLARSRIVGLLDSRNLDALVHPTTPYPAARRGAAQPSANCGLAATSGLPALAMPHALGPDGLPAVGVDVVGRPFAELRLLQIAHRYEQEASLTFPAAAIPR